MGLTFLRIAVVYLLVGAVLGLVMGITQKFTLAPAATVVLGGLALFAANVLVNVKPARA